MNLDKFSAILLDKWKSNYTGTKVTADSKEIQDMSSANLLDVTMDDKLNFNLHINRICKPTPNQINALINLKHFLGSTKRFGI